MKEELQKPGHVSQGSVVAGGGGQSAMTVLKTRVVSGDPPKVVQMREPAVQDWASQDTLVDLDAVAGGWTPSMPARRNSLPA